MLLAALLLAAAAASPAPPVTDAPPAEPQRYATLMVFGADPCPRSTDDEIVVCARLPEGERYRIPKRLRQMKTREGQEGVSWAAKADSLEWVGRVGTPNSCSPVGSGGATGCFQQFMRQARAERAMDQQEAAGVR